MTTRLLWLLLVLSCVLSPREAAAQILPAIPSSSPPRIQSTTSTNVPGRRPAPNGTDGTDGTDGTKFDEEDLQAASGPKLAPEARGPQPFGANLFMGNFMRAREDGLNPDYVIMPGDHVAVNTWGALQIASVFVVDGQGNVFLPEIGPIQLAGVRNADLTSTVRRGLSRVYTRYFDVYTNLITAKPVAVFVTGGVTRPGRYAGVPSDSALFFLDQAGGIDAHLGSYRNVEILRDGQPLATIDLYDFILKGTLPAVQFKDGDTILVKKRGPVVDLQGSVARPAQLEFKQADMLGAEALDVVPGAARATAVTVTGLRGGAPMGQTFSIADFSKFRLQNGDRILLRDDGLPGTILIQVEGEYRGPSVLAVRRGARLVDVLHRIPVDPSLAEVTGVHLRRPSVAKQQKQALDDSLFRLERSALLALSDSDGETNIRIKEADLVQRFVERAHNIQPLGRVVTSRDGKQLNVVLEDGDVVIIPQKTNVVRVSGEVFMTKAIMYTPGMTAKDYIQQAGGYSDRADKGRVVLHRPNAEVIVGSGSIEVHPGDEILVPPKVDTKLTQNILDVTQIIYQVAVSAAVILFLVP
jgi:protein involved in polysaccharide export with SLBB domain